MRLQTSFAALAAICTATLDTGPRPAHEFQWPGGSLVLGIDVDADAQPLSRLVPHPLEGLLKEPVDVGRE